jgi:hypothetical protein
MALPMKINGVNKVSLLPKSAGWSENINLATERVEPPLAGPVTLFHVAVSILFVFLLAASLQLAGGNAVPVSKPSANGKKLEFGGLMLKVKVSVSFAGLWSVELLGL